LLIFLELFLKNIGFVVRVLDNNQGSSGFRLYIRGGGITSIFACMSAASIWGGGGNDIIFRVELIGFVLV
jgi:hypothetical protein